MMIDSFRQKLTGPRASQLPLQGRPSNNPSISSNISNPLFPSNESYIQQPEILTSNTSIANSAIKNIQQKKGGNSMGGSVLNRASSSNFQNTMKKVPSHISLNHPLASQTIQHFSVENFFNNKYQNEIKQQQQQYQLNDPYGKGASGSCSGGSIDFIRDVPSLRSYGGSIVGGLGLGGTEKEVKYQGRWQMEKQQMNQKQIIIPHDNKGLVMLYGKDEQRKNRNSKDETVTTNVSGSLDDGNSIDNLFKRRSSSVQQKYGQTTNKKNSLNEKTNKKFLATTLFGNFQPAQDVASYKKDAINLLANRIQKKLREYFHVVVEFALFQEEVQILAKYDSKFDIGEAFETFKQKQELKGTKNLTQLKFQRQSHPTHMDQMNELLQSQRVVHATGLKIKQQRGGKSIQKENKENIFLSQDKLASKTYFALETEKNNQNTRKNHFKKDTTPVNIFQTYLQGQNMVSPIEMDPLLLQEQNDEMIVDEIFDFNQQFDLQQQQRTDKSQKKFNMKEMKSSFKDKIKGLKSNFTELLSQRQPSIDESKPFQDALGKVTTNMMMTQRYIADKENTNNINKLLQSQGVAHSGSLTSRKTPLITLDQINTNHHLGKQPPLKMNILKQKRKVVQNSKQGAGDISDQCLTQNECLEDDTFRQKTQQTFIDQTEHLREFQSKPKEVLDKLLELIQIKELKMKFFAVYHWKNLHLKSDGGHDSSFNVSYINPQLINASDKDQGKQISIENEQRMITLKDRKMSVVRMIANGLQMKGQYIMQTSFQQWRSFVKSDHNQEAKIDVLRQVIYQMQTSQRFKAFRKWKEDTLTKNEQKQALKRECCVFIKEQLKIVAFKELHSAFNKWKKQESGTTKRKQIRLQRLLQAKEFRQKNQALKRLQLSQLPTKRTFSSQRETSNGRSTAQNLRYL